MKRQLTGVLTILLIGTLLSAACATADADPANGSSGENTVIFNVGLLLPGSINDGAWNTSAYRGMLDIEEVMGARTEYVEHATADDAERLFRDYGDRGFEVVFGHGIEYAKAAKQVAPAYPDTWFILTGTDTVQEPNVASMDTDHFHQGFFQGATAALFSETGKVGVVDGLPIPPIEENFLGIESGARYVNNILGRKGQIIQLSLVHWGDLEGAERHTAEILKSGADVIVANANDASTIVHRMVSEAGMWSIHSQAMNFEGGERILGASATSMTGAFRYMAEMVHEGTIDSRFYRLGASEGIVVFALNPQWKETLDPERVQQLEAILAEVIAGELEPRDY